MTIERKYPVFRDPERYRETRRPRGYWERWTKSASEYRTIDRCLDGLTGIETVCDIPTGPGRLFPYWQRRGYTVLGYDYSDEMVAAAGEALGEYGLEGEVKHADAFKLGELAPASADLVASVRFIYYFDAPSRVELLKSLAAASRRYVLVQYKTTETLKGHMNEARDAARTRRPRPEHLAKSGCSHAQILRELTAAGLVPIRIDPIGELSDRVYVLAEKLGATVPEDAEAAETRVSISNVSLTSLPVVVFLLLAMAYLAGLGTRGLWEQTEAYVALGARSVLNGQAILPLLHSGQTVFSPPGSFWWYALGGWLFQGVDETSVFLMSLLSALLVLGATYRVGVRWAGREVALLAMIILGTSMEFRQLACAANREMLTALFAIGIFDGIMALRAGQGRTSGPWTLWASLALIPLTGGAPWMAAGLVAVVAATGLRHWRSLLLAQLPFGFWATIATAEHGFTPMLEAFLRWSASPMATIIGDANPWYYFLAHLPENLLPWSLLLIPLAALAVQQRSLRLPEAWQRQALLFIALGLVALSLRAAKEEYHLIPLGPMASLLLASFVWYWALAAAQSSATASASQGRRFWGRFLGTRAGRLGAGLALALTVLIAVFALVGNRMRERWESSLSLEVLVRHFVDADEPLMVFEDTDLRLLFHLPASTRFVTGSREDWAPFMDQLEGPDAMHVLVNESDAEKFRQRFAVTFVEEGSAVFRGERYLLLKSTAGEDAPAPAPPAPPAA